MAMSVKYPIGIQQFEKLREEGFLYIDKTALIQKLVQEGTYYFLSRPRRFGKSLLLSTIQAYFEGKRELFKGLAIDTDEMSGEAHPVMHLDLNTEKYDTEKVLENKLGAFLIEYETVYGKRMEIDRYSQILTTGQIFRWIHAITISVESAKWKCTSISGKELQNWQKPMTSLQMHDYNLEMMTGIETDADVLNSIDGGSTDPIPVIYQSGYLTIKDYDREFGLYKLGYPNKEVEEGFMKFLVPFDGVAIG